MAYTPKWRKVIEWVLENFNEPVWADANTLNSAFNMATDGSRKDKMTFYFLITKQNQGPQDRDKLDGPTRFVNWYKANRDYLPTDLRDCLNTNDHNAIKHIQSEESIQLIHDFNEWFFSMMDKVEMDLTQRYFNGGAKRFMDILERRFRKNWGLNKETTIETKKTTDNEELVIKFTEA